MTFTYDYNKIRNDLEDDLYNEYPDGATADQIWDLIEDLKSSYMPKEKRKPGSVDMTVLDNPQRLFDDVMSRYVRRIPPQDPAILDGDQKNHVDWLNADIKTDWKYWPRYEKYLLNKKNSMRKSAVKDLDRYTDKVLMRMENPLRQGPWQTKGLVIGNVQSGKTANYTGLICKAADAGYKKFIILTGVIEDLRSQTQGRIDEGFLGYYTGRRDRRKPTGVRDVKIVGSTGSDAPKVSTFTTVDQDFTGNKDDIIVETDISCYVIKKQKDVLEKVFDSLNTPSNYDVPILIIDDEADNASVNALGAKNTNPDQKKSDIRVINGWIRKILNLSSRTAYIGYTATPYANVFINPENYSDEYGSDLFPSDFIISLPIPEGYFGAMHFFGTADESDDDNKEFPGVSLVPVEEYEQLIPPDERRNSLYKPKRTNLPPSLYEAVYSFILATAVRRVRSANGQKNIHNSMLLHVTQYKEVHKQLRKLLEDIIRPIRNGLIDENEETYSLLHDVWIDYNHISQDIREEYHDPLCTDVSWEEVRAVLPAVLDEENFKVLSVNSISEEKLDYTNHPDGLSVIAVGGNSLSRGLTLEGLSISYFLRDAGSYDSLLQMGRWFGYRSGYLDLCRVYIRESIVDKFRIVAAADANLREQIQKMMQKGARPDEYPLMIMENDPRFRACQLSKRRNTTTVEYNNYSGKLVQTTVSWNTPDILKENYGVLEDFIRSLGDPSKMPDFTGKTGHYVWENVDSTKIINGLYAYQHHEDNRSKGKELLNYIRKQNFQKNPELTSWTVAVIQKHRDVKYTNNLAGYPVNLSIRNPEIKDSDVFRNVGSKGIVSKKDESLDLTRNEKAVANALFAAEKAINEAKQKQQKLLDEDIQEIRNQAENQYDETKDDIAAKYYRRVRSIRKGLLLIYLVTWDERKESTPLILFGYSFPDSPTAVSETYRTQSTWIDMIWADKEEEDYES